MLNIWPGRRDLLIALGGRMVSTFGDGVALVALTLRLQADRTAPSLSRSVLLATGARAAPDRSERRRLAHAERRAGRRDGRGGIVEPGQPGGTSSTARSPGIPARLAGDPRATVFRVERLVVARHGESDYSARGLLNGDSGRRCPLTATGREQARRLGELLRDEPIDLCATSTFERTRETAAIAFAARAIPRLVVADLADHPAGDFEGKGIAEYLAWANASPSGEPIPGAGESRVDVVHRFARGYRLLLARPERTIVAVLHSLPISYLLTGPLQRLPLLPYAEPALVAAADVRNGIERLEQWAAAPTW